MKTLVEFLHRTDWAYTFGSIIYELDESSYYVIEEGKRLIYTTNDGDNLRMSDHATQRKNRPVEQGGDNGKPISEAEIINMFRWSWNDIMQMEYEGKLKPFNYQQRRVDAWTIECQCWLNSRDTQDNQVEYGGARPRSKNLWAVWSIRENNRKFDIVIHTIFRGADFRHTSVQERIRIDTKGKVKQLYRI